MKVAPKIHLDQNERILLRALVADSRETSPFITRARIILLAVEGLENQAIASELGISRQNVGRWRKRFAQSGISGIRHDKSRSGRPLTISKTKKTRTANRTQNELPPGAKRWTRRSMALASGLSASTIGRIWHEHGIKPHQPASKPIVEKKEMKLQRL